MMRSYRASVMAVALGFVACGGPRGPSPAELAPLAHQTAPRQPLPDDVERATGRLAAVVLANQTDIAAEILGATFESDGDEDAD